MLNPDINDGVTLDNEFQKSLAKKRSMTQLATMKKTNAILVIVTLLSLFIALFSLMGWRVSSDRFASNVRVMYVKLSPDGTHQVSYFNDGGTNNRWYEQTVNASLINYIEHRFQQQRATIGHDYGYALQFMGPAVSQDFRDVYGAAEVAAQFVDCVGCPEVDVHFRAIDHETLQAPKSEADISTAVYKTTAYITLQERNDAGVIIQKNNKIISLVWRLLPAADVAANPNALNANPLGISIINQKVKDDLTTSQ